jgi:hypothetical protein
MTPCMAAVCIPVSSASEEDHTPGGEKTIPGRNHALVRLTRHRPPRGLLSGDQEWQAETSSRFLDVVVPYMTSYLKCLNLYPARTWQSRLFCFARCRYVRCVWIGRREKNNRKNGTTLRLDCLSPPLSIQREKERPCGAKVSTLISSPNRRNCWQTRATVNAASAYYFRSHVLQCSFQSLSTVRYKMCVAEQSWTVAETVVPLRMNEFSAICLIS